MPDPDSPGVSNTKIKKKKSRPKRKSDRKKRSVFDTAYRPIDYKPRKLPKRTTSFPTYANEDDYPFESAEEQEHPDDETWPPRKKQHNKVMAVADTSVADPVDETVADPEDEPAKKKKKKKKVKTEPITGPCAF